MNDGKVKVHLPSDLTIKKLICCLALKEWKTASTLVLKYAELREEKNKKIPIQSLLLALLLLARETVQRQLRTIEFRPLLTATTTLFRSGAKFEDLIRLNRLGVCMSPTMVVSTQRKMGEQLEAKVKVWKTRTEDNRGTLLLCKEVARKQNIPPSGEPMMP